MMMLVVSPPLTRADIDSLDQADELGFLRDAFVLPDDVVYLDGNSLGALPIRAVKRLGTLVEEEWGQGLVRSWNDSGWIELPELVATALAPLLGASPDEVHEGGRQVDSTDGPPLGCRERIGNRWRRVHRLYVRWGGISGPPE